ETQNRYCRRCVERLNGFDIGSRSVLPLVSSAFRTDPQVFSCSLATSASANGGKLRAFAIGVFFDSSYPSCGRLSRHQTTTPSPPPPEGLGKFRWGFPCLLPLPFAPFGRFPVFSM